MESIKILEKHPGTLFIGFPAAIRGKDGHFLAGEETSGYLKDFKKREIYPSL